MALHTEILSNLQKEIVAQISNSARLQGIRPIEKNQLSINIPTMNN